MSATKADKSVRFSAFLAAVVAAGLVISAVNGGTYSVIARCEAFVLVSWSLTLGLTVGLLPRGQPPRLLSSALLFLIGYTAWIAVSLLWTESSERTVIELTRDAGFVSLLAALAVGVRNTDWYALLAAVTGAAVAVCAVALAVRLAPDLAINPISVAGLTRRLSYPLNYWNAVGCWAAMTVTLSLGWSLQARTWPVRGAALAGACLAGTVVYLTFSRSAVAGVLLGTIALVALCRHRWLAASHALVVAAGTGAIVLVIRSKPQIELGSGGSGGGVVALAAALVFAACLPAALAAQCAGLERLRTPPHHLQAVIRATAVLAVVIGVLVGPTLAGRVWHSFERPTPAVTGDPAHRLTTLGGTRKLLWQVALGSFERHPLDGSGAGTFDLVWNRDPRRAYFSRDAHSLYLESLGELGLPGGLLIVAALGCLLTGAMWTARRRDLAGAGAAAGGAAAVLVFCVCAGVDWMWESTAVTLLALTVGAVTMAARSKPIPGVPLPRRAALIGLAAVAVAVQLPVLASAVQVRVSQQAARVRDFERAVAAASTAVQASPWAATPYVQRAVVLEALGLLDRARADARRATAREPTNWENWLVLARVEAEAGRTRAAVADARRAAALNPRGRLFRTPPPKPLTRTAPRASPHR